MKFIKKATALFLCFLMLSAGSISVFAQTDVFGNDMVAESNSPTEAVEVCEECGFSDAHAETCFFNTANNLNTETTQRMVPPLWKMKKMVLQ